MTDLHCHILPGVDDGAKSIDTAISLLKSEKKQGVDKIVFTPHFDCRRQSIQEFLKVRDSSYLSLLSDLQKELLDHFTFKLGAEVFFSPALRGTDLHKLCFLDTNYLLLELPFNKKPNFLKETLFEIQNEDIIPIIAHIERYDYMLSDITQIYDLIEDGALIQTNSETLLENNRLIHKMINWDLIQIVSSDTHSEHNRPVTIENGLNTLSDENKLRVIQNGDLIFDGQEIKTKPHYPKKTFGIWH